MTKTAPALTKECVHQAQCSLSPSPSPPSGVTHDIHLSFMSSLMFVVFQQERVPIMLQRYKNGSGPRSERKEKKEKKKKWKQIAAEKLCVHKLLLLL